MTGNIVFWLAVAVLLFWSLGAYNRLVRLRAQVISRFAGVDQRMVQALGLLGEAVTARDAASDTRAGLQAAMVQFEVALRVARKQPLDANAVAALQTAHATVHTVWTRSPGESAGLDVTAAAVMQRAWEDNTQVVREAVADYNAAVHDYNAAIRQFPASVLAYFFGFGPAAPL
ncbi:MAG: LemA family protein [Burkholderiaceae bacterium]|nr:LemA family protein [Rhodoferax sp.]MCB2003644.1 LemA family protein [Rhodoferax sp.]MCB2028404.1 LemA family protein [Rhodoferax sp.]MCB2039663.1 LemA family protein [Rhodoferax sp.]MCP5263102.1 LemA family protein [Rhodoferax sp.]